jgi:hypothetical protein
LHCRGIAPLRQPAATCEKPRGKLRNGLHFSLLASGRPSISANRGVAMRRVIVGLATTVSMWGGVAGWWAQIPLRPNPPLCRQALGPAVRTTTQRAHVTGVQGTPGADRQSSGELRVVWDWNVCHTYFYVPFGVPMT